MTGRSLSISGLDYSGMSRAMLPTPNPSGLTDADLIDGPAADLMRLVMNNFLSFTAMEPLLLFLKDTFWDAGLGSSAGNSDLIDGDHEEEPIYDK